MSFKIDCLSKHEREEQGDNNFRRSVVEVFFPDRSIICSYYNDMFDLKRGDIVYVEGKLAGLRGHVCNVHYTFKVKLSDYKRVIGVAETDIVGEFQLAGLHFITTDCRALPFEQAITWFRAKEDVFVSNEGGEVFNLSNLYNMRIDKAIADRGRDYFFERRIAYIELKKGKGRAIVKGTRTYEVDFNFENGNVSGLVCSCYCTYTCKHEFAVMFQLEETLGIIARKYKDIDINDYIAIVDKTDFFENAINIRAKCKITMG